MEAPKEKTKNYLRAKEKVRKIKLFYIHLAGYIIILLLLAYNFLILDKNNEYADFITKFNTIIMIVWTIFIALHAWNVFKGSLFFKKSWEDRKLKEYMEKEETKWE